MMMKGSQNRNGMALAPSYHVQMYLLDGFAGFIISSPAFSLPASPTSLPPLRRRAISPSAPGSSPVRLLAHKLRHPDVLLRA